MHCYKEVYKGSRDNIRADYTKIFNEKGKIIKEVTFNFDIDYEFDAENRVIKISKYPFLRESESVEEVTVSTYEYHPSGYDIITKKTQEIYEGIYPKTFSKGIKDCKKINGNYVKDVNEVLSIKQIKILNNKIVSKKIINLKDNETIEIDYTYDNNLLTSKKKVKIISNVKQLIYKKTFTYDNELKINMKIYRELSGVNYLAFETKYYYNKDKIIEKKEYFSTYNKKMVKIGVYLTTKIYGGKISESKFWGLTYPLSSENDFMNNSYGQYRDEDSDDKDINIDSEYFNYTKYDEFGNKIFIKDNIDDDCITIFSNIYATYNKITNENKLFIKEVLESQTELSYYQPFICEKVGTKKKFYKNEVEGYKKVF